MTLQTHPESGSIPAEQQEAAQDLDIYRPFYLPWKAPPILIDTPPYVSARRPFLTRPFLAPLLFNNAPPSSNARDHCANERTFLSLLRLSVYLAVVSLAILTSYHLKHQPSGLERRVALPLGLCFCALSLATLVAGWINYVRTVVRYARKIALVQRGVWSELLMVLGVGGLILGSCIVFLIGGAENRAREREQGV